MSCDMVGYVLLNPGHTDNNRQSLVHFRITAKAGELCYIVSIKDR